MACVSKSNDHVSKHAKIERMSDENKLLYKHANLVDLGRYANDCQCSFMVKAVSANKNVPETS